MYLENPPKFYPMSEFDVTQRCNLRCQHCYFFRVGFPPDRMDDTETFEKLKILQERHNILIMSWNGGEPMLRQDLICKGFGLFKKNFLFTNGTHPFDAIDGYPDLKICISLDGPPEINDSIRGKGVFEKAIRNIKNLRQTPVGFAHTITRMNSDYLEQTVEQLYNTDTQVETKILLIFFVPLKEYKPVPGYKFYDQTDMFIPLEERDKIIDRIIALKEKYPSFIFNQVTPLLYMKSSMAASTMSRCPIPRFGLCLDTNLDRKKQCTYGEGADCPKCGCEAAPAFAAFLDGHDVQMELMDHLMDGIIPEGLVEKEDDLREITRSYLAAGLLESKREENGRPLIDAPRIASKIASLLPAQTIARATFDFGLRAALLKNRSKLAGKSAVIQFRITDIPNGNWYIAVKNGKGKVHKGEAKNPDSTVSMKAEVLKGIASRQTDHVRSAISGDIKASVTLDSYKILDSVLGVPI